MEVDNPPTDGERSLQMHLLGTSARACSGAYSLPEEHTGTESVALSHPAKIYALLQVPLQPCKLLVCCSPLRTRRPGPPPLARAGSELS